MQILARPLGSPPETDASLADGRDARPRAIPAWGRELKLAGLALLYVLLAHVVPAPEGIEPQAWRRFAIFVVTIVGMILQPVPAAALVFVGITAFVIIGGLPLAEGLAGFGSAPVWLLVGAMLMARVLMDTGLSRRIALMFVRRFGGSSLGVVYSLVLTDISLAGAIPSISARSGGIVLPIAKSIGELYNSSAGSTAPLLGTFLMTALYQSSVVACAMFLTGQAGNLLAAALALKVAGVSVTWSSWFVAAIVPGIVSIVVIPYLVYRVQPPIITRTPAAPEYARQQLQQMGRLSRAEKGALAVIGSMCLLWATGGWTGFEATTVALVGISILILANILRWDSALADRPTWDVFIWYGGLVTMGQQLNETGVPGVFAASIGGLFTGVSWFPVLLAVLLIYFYTHYGFATVTVHVLAMYAPFVALLLSLGAPPQLTVYSFACLSALPAGLTHYGTTTAPLFIRGYVTVADWWKVGFLASIVNLAIWLTVGFAWWKFLGFW